MISIGFEEDATVKLWDICTENIIDKNHIHKKNGYNPEEEKPSQIENQIEVETDKEVSKSDDNLRLVSSFTLTKNEIATNAISFSKTGDYFLTCGAFHITYWPFKTSQESSVIV